MDGRYMSKKQPNYVDVMMAVVPSSHLDEYLNFGKKIGKLLLKYGALSNTDLVADDRNALADSIGKKFSLKKGEVLVIGTAGFRSRAHRDQVMKKMSKDPLMAQTNSSPSWLDHKRSFAGGFKAKNSMMIKG